MIHFVHDNGGRVCSHQVSFDYDQDTNLVHNVEFLGGCMGNTQGVARLAEGRSPEELIGILKGVECRGVSSCPNEFACGLEEMLAELSEMENAGVEID